MSKLERRKTLHTYVADLDDEKVTALLTLLEPEMEYHTKQKLSEDDKKEIRKREEDRLSGKSKVYPVTQTKKLVRRKPR